MKLELAPELDLLEAFFSSRKSYSNNIKTNETKTNHKGVQEHKKYTLEDYKNSLEKIEIKNGVY